MSRSDNEFDDIIEDNGFGIVTGVILGLISGGLITTLIFLCFNPKAELFEVKFNLSTILQVLVTSYIALVIATRFDLKKSQRMAAMTDRLSRVRSNKTDALNTCTIVTNKIRQFHSYALATLEAEKLRTPGTNPLDQTTRSKIATFAEKEIWPLLEQLLRECDEYQFIHSSSPRPKMSFVNAPFRRALNNFRAISRTYFSAITTALDEKTPDKYDALITTTKSNYSEVEDRMIQIRRILQ